MRGLAIVTAVPALLEELRGADILEQLHRSELEARFVPLPMEFHHDADFLAQRLIHVAERETGGLPIAYIGVSSGAAAAIVAASLRPELVSAVVSIDGRTDLAVDALRDLHTPLLLIVKDMPVLWMNREALAKVRGDKRLEVVHASEPGAAEHVVQKCVSWLAERMVGVHVSG